MTDDLPAPLVDAAVDLRDFAFMPLDVLRLRDSELASVQQAEVFRCSVLSWCASWHQLPAASLPDDDVALARLLGFGRDVKGWKRVRASGGMRGWVLCNDGRLYHPVVAEKARDAWTAKLAQRARTEAARRAREEARQKQLQSLSVQTQTPVTESVTEPVTEPVTASKGQGQGQGQGQGYLKPNSAHQTRTELTEPAPTRIGAVCALLRKEGVQATPAHPTVRGWVEAGATDEQIVEAVERTRLRKPAPEPIPVAYFDAVLRDVMSPPARASPAKEAAWWATEKATEAMGKKVGLHPRGGESWDEFRGRIRAKMATATVTTLDAPGSSRASVAGTQA